MQQALATCKQPVHVLTELQPVVQAVTIEGRSYDICVLQGQSVLLLVESIEDVKAPGLLWKLAQEAAGCTAFLVEQSTDICCPVMFELDTKGVYSFTPHERQGGESYGLSLS